MALQGPINAQQRPYKGPINAQQRPRKTRKNVLFDVIGKVGNLRPGRTKNNTR